MFSCILNKARKILENMRISLQVCMLFMRMSNRVRKVLTTLAIGIDSDEAVSKFDNAM